MKKPSRPVLETETSEGWSLSLSLCLPPPPTHAPAHTRHMHTRGQFPFITWEAPSLLPFPGPSKLAVNCSGLLSASNRASSWTTSAPASFHFCRTETASPARVQGSHLCRVHHLLQNGLHRSSHSFPLSLPHPTFTLPPPLISHSLFLSSSVSLSSFLHYVFWIPGAERGGLQQEIMKH